MRKRVVVVDDDDISRRGLAELLSDRPELEVAGSLVHDDALEWDREWDTIDIAIVDAADSRRDDDHFPGVGVVDHIRRRRGREQTMVIVLTGHFFDDAVRRRMREAQADFFFHRSELQESADLYRAILYPEQARSGVPDGTDPEAQFRLGIVPTTHINDAVRFSRSTGLGAKLTSRQGNRSRSWSRLRTSFNDVAHLNPVNSDGTPPERYQRDPSLTQIERFLNWATRVKNPPS
jgi:DNA-binding NarL/FixJ family response regulator